jgi:uncharacterized membrane protein
LVWHESRYDDVMPQAPDPVQAPVSSTGLSPRAAAALAYAGWWVTGLVFYCLERERFARFHAAQAVAAFGAIAVLVLGCLGLAAMALSFMPAAFLPLVWTAGLTWLLGVGLWIAVMWKAASGETWRIPGAARVADRLV